MSLNVVPAIGVVLERILDDTYPLWHDGLPRGLWQVLGGAAEDAVGRRAPRSRGAAGGPHVVASAKRYDLAFTVDGRVRRVLGIGAVFTASAYRGRGAARELLTRIMETAEAEGYEFAALFSEISPAFYERLDFVPVPLNECRLDVDRKNGGPPATLVRSGDDRDLHFIGEMSATRASGARLSMARSEDYIRYGITRSRLLAGLGAPGVREVEFLVSEEGHQAAAYLVCVRIRACGRSRMPATAIPPAPASARCCR